MGIPAGAEPVEDTEGDGDGGCACAPDPAVAAAEPRVVLAAVAAEMFGLDLERILAEDDDDEVGEAAEVDVEADVWRLGLKGGGGGITSLAGRRAAGSPRISVRCMCSVWPEYKSPVMLSKSVLESKRSTISHFTYCY